MVTGASSGFGRAIARAARDAGWQVLGTVRKAADAESLEAEGIATATMDLALPDTIASGCETALAWCDGRLDAVVHNAGSTWPGPIELMPLDQLRLQFEVNVFGHIDVTQRLLPAIREAGGHMLFISSDSTSITPPLIGAYAASKRALEAMAEALAQETLGQGITVSVIAPGPYATSIWETAKPRGEGFLNTEDARVARYRHLAEALSRATVNRPMGDASDFAAVVLANLESSNPPFRRVVPLEARLTTLVRSVLPTRLFHRLYVAEILRRGRPDE